jgi:hypothetical protein
MEPSLKEMVPYDPAELAGFAAHHYEVDLADGFGAAKRRMESVVDGMVRRDIGGDEQEVSSLNIAFYKVSFKHVLLPVYMASYIFRGQAWQVYIDGRSGAVTGNRPYSVPKILFLIIFIAAVAAGIGVGIYFGVR